MFLQKSVRRCWGLGESWSVWRNKGYKTSRREVTCKKLHIVFFNLISLFETCQFQPYDTLLVLSPFFSMKLKKLQKTKSIGATRHLIFTKEVEPWVKKNGVIVTPFKT